MNKEMLQPNDWVGPAKNTPESHFDWLRQLPNNTYCVLWQSFPTEDLPPGYDLYVVAFRESVAVPWLREQAQKSTAPILLLHNEKNYNLKIENVEFYRFLVWHHQVDQILMWNPTPIEKQIKFKASAFCNRISQSKMLVFTKLIETLGEQNCLLKLSTWLEEKNVHFRQPTGQAEIDHMADIFWSRYWGKEYKIDDFDPKNNFQKFTSNTDNPAYSETALNFTNESFHYSYMQENNTEYIWPGPFLTEKTLTCLAAGTAFVPVGQFDTYGTLKELGLEFDYGFDTAWDQDPGNLTRMLGIFKLIDWLKDYSAQDIYDMTAASTARNLETIKAGIFFDNCEQINQRTIDQVLARYA